MKNLISEGIGVVTFELMKKNEDMIAQIDAIAGVKETHGKLRNRAIKVAQKMQTIGLTSGDAISICSFNNIDCFVPYVAALFLGVKVVPLDPYLTVRECVHIINLTEPKLIFCDTDSVKLVEESVKCSNSDIKIIVFGFDSKYTAFYDFVIDDENENSFKPTPVDQNETAIIIFTSGTTGLPKGICLSHFAILTQIMKYNMPVTVLTFSRLYWIGGSLIPMASLLTGSCRVIAKEFDHTTFFRHLYDYKVNAMLLSPFISEAINEHPECNIYDTSYLNLIVIGGSVVTGQQILKLRKIFPHTTVVLSYGMTETCGVGTTFLPQIHKKLIDAKPASSGKVSEEAEIKVIDLETNEECGPNQIGEIYIRTPSVMKEYYKNPEETVKIFDADGYIKTGDLGYYDEDGCFYIEDRIKDLLKYHLMHISPSELEGILKQHPDVKNALVISIQQDSDGDHPLAVVVLKEGSEVSEEELIKHVDGQVPDYKRLRGGVKFVKSLPTTVTGKYKKLVLRSMILENKI